MAASTPRRVRVERGIYRRPTGVFEVGYKDESGRQRWCTVDGGILAARKVHDDLTARRARGESIAPKAKLRFGDAAAAWLDGPVLDLRETTQVKYRCIVREHLNPRFGERKLDALSADDKAKVVRELRAEGKSEATIAVALSVVGRVYKFAARRLGWSGTIPTTLMLQSERPKPSQAKRRPIFIGEQLEQTITAAHEPFRTLFIVAALTGARISELCGLTWTDIRIDDLDDDEIEFCSQVDRHGNMQPTKTDGSARTVPIPHDLGAVLQQHRRKARYIAAGEFVFATGTGRPLQRATFPARSANPNGGPSTRTGSRPFPSSTRSTPPGSRRWFHAAHFPRCTHSVTQSRPGRYSPARASTKSPSSSATAMGP